MVFKVRDIVRDVKVAIDQNAESGELAVLRDPETLELDELIGSKVEEAAGMVMAVAPVHVLDTALSDFSTEDLFWNAEVSPGATRSARVVLPDDFLRLVRFRMSDWERPVTEVITPEDPVYARQFSRFGGLRGCPQKPVCAVSRQSSGIVMEIFSCRDDRAEVADALYVRIPRVDRDGGIDIPERCYRAMVYQTAALTLSSLGDGNLASVMGETSKQMMI